MIIVKVLFISKFTRDIGVEYFLGGIFLMCTHIFGLNILFFNHLKMKYFPLIGGGLFHFFHQKRAKSTFWRWVVLVWRCSRTDRFWRTYVTCSKSMNYIRLSEYNLAQTAFKKPRRHRSVGHTPFLALKFLQKTQKIIKNFFLKGERVFENHTFLGVFGCFLFY